MDHRAESLEDFCLKKVSKCTQNREQAKRKNIA